MSTLVLGGTSFIGLEIVWQLLLAGHRVTVLALDPPLPEVAPHVDFVCVNRRDEAALTAALAGRRFDAVVDNIAYVPADVERLVRALSGRIGRYLMTSTVDIYGHSFPRSCAEHQAPQGPAEPADGPLAYDVGKRGCEWVLRESGLQWTVVRPCIVMGRRDNVSPEPHRHATWSDEALSRAMFYPSRVLDGGPILLRDDDEGMFRLVWSADVARAVVHLLGHEPAVGQAYNATSDEIWTAERLAMALCHIAGREPDLVRVSAALLEQAGLADYEPPYGFRPYWSVAENHKLRQTGWRPTPAEDWMPRLLEAELAGRGRGYYERRHVEIALALHVKRRRAALPALPQGGAVIPVEQIAGGLDAAQSRSWAEQARTPQPAAAHWKSLEERVVSGIGLGTHMGDPGPVTDAMYVAAMVRAVHGGINVLDTAINYRGMRAERCVGQALRQLRTQGVGRGAVLVATKGGFMSWDADMGLSHHDYVREAYLAPGLVSEAEAQRYHSLGARYLRRSLEQSLRNLGLCHVDVYFLHNPEVARETMDAVEFQRVLRDAFAMLEEAVAEGKVGAYGLAAWNGPRVPPEDRRHVSLSDALAAAREVAGERHHFKLVQMPYNVRDEVALQAPTQQVGGRLLPALQAAAELGLYTFTSGTLLQGQGIDEGLAQRLQQLAQPTWPAAMLQVARSVPEIGTALVGMRRVEHVEEALAVAAQPLLPAGAW